MWYGYSQFHCMHKIDDSYKYIAEDVENRFDNSSYELDTWFPKGKNTKVIGLMKDELGRNFMTKFVGLRAKKQKTQKSVS